MKARRRTCSLAVAVSLALGACAKDASDWAEDLASPDAYVRGLASIGWSLQDPRGAGPALPVLLGTIDRSEVGLEREAAQVLSAVGAFHVDALLAQLAGDDILTGDRRGAILNALVAAGPAAPEPIVRCLAGPGRDQAGDLGEVLLLIGPPSVPAVRTLAESPDDPALQQFALFLLARLGQPGPAPGTRR